MKTITYKGTLATDKKKSYLLGQNGEQYLENELIWDGYINHWTGKELFARHLIEKDYKTEKNIIIMWPVNAFDSSNYVELYYNERLVKYPISIFGHLAINISGNIFNFSHLLNENEIIKPEEYFFRPALGEFAPHPVTGKFNIENKKMPYYDKFGRLFMRTIHVGLNTDLLLELFLTKLEEIKNSPINPAEPEKYSNFHFFTESCATIIRDGLNKYGLTEINGIFPRDMFINSANFFMNRNTNKNLSAKIFKLKQLKVPEASYSSLTPIINPLNRIRIKKFPKY